MTAPVQIIRKKFGVTVFRAAQGNQTYVGKDFGGADSKEIQYYELLQALGVPTLRVLAHTGRLLLLEDLETSETYRLGTEQDMADCDIARFIAAWFKRLHAQNAPGLACLYDTDELSAKNIKKAIKKTHSQDNPFWPLLVQNLDAIKSAYPRLCNAITYNDFWWDNLAVARDGSSALIFDYNCLSRSYAYSEIRHILSVLTKDAGVAFLDAYGEYNEEEKAFDDLFFPLTGLLSPWADKYTELLHNGELMVRLKEAIK
jgi:hypothetical protein